MYGLVQEDIFCFL